MEPTKEKLRQNPRRNRCSLLGLLSYLSFTWILPILLKGRNNKLEIDDIYETLSDHSSDVLGDRLEKSWKNEIKNKKRKQKSPSLMRAGLKTFGVSILCRGVLVFIFELAFRVTVPLLLGRIIRDHSTQLDSEESVKTETYMYAGGIILCNFCSVLSNHLLLLSNLTLGMKVRIAACSMIYRKALTLGKNALINTSAGQIVNLISNDVARYEIDIEIEIIFSLLISKLSIFHRFDSVVMFSHYLWVGPIEMVIVTYLMYKEVSQGQPGFNV